MNYLVANCDQKIAHAMRRTERNHPEYDPRWVDVIERLMDWKLALVNGN